jgi:hypothetical protein
MTPVTSNGRLQVRKLWESGKYKDWEGKGPGDCYGAEHLTRMIVNLPEMIVSSPSWFIILFRLFVKFSPYCLKLTPRAGSDQYGRRSRLPPED